MFAWKILSLLEHTINLRKSQVPCHAPFEHNSRSISGNFSQGQDTFPTPKDYTWEYMIKQNV